MLRLISMSIVCLMITLSCAQSSGSKEQADPPEPVAIKPGMYAAVVSMENVPDDVKAYNVTSKISFGFEPDNTFIYKVSAMGHEIEDVGRWEIRGDSLYINSLQKGPDSAFKLVKVNDDRYEIFGPNHFILTKQEEIAPIKE
ncbi:MAG: hypothetical protein KDC53_07790 [Saprospiraceae bacterium]|nr:hypothetical protein [Saprospiraceae bacterium]